MDKKDPKFSTALTRKQNEIELDRLIEAWTLKLDPDDVMGMMQHAGPLSWGTHRTGLHPDSLDE